MSSTHTWKPGASGLITDPANYVDGTSLEPGDTLVLHDGVANADGIGTLSDVTLSFVVTGAQAEFDFQDLTLAASLTLDITGPGPVSLQSTGNSVSQGSIDIAAGAATLTIFNDPSQSAGSFSNDGTLEIGNAGVLTVDPFQNGIFLNSGVLDIGAGGTLDYSDLVGTGNTADGILRNDSTVTVDGTGAKLQVGSFYQGTAGNLLTVAGDASAVLDDPATGANISLASASLTVFSTMQSSTVTFADDNAILYLDYVQPTLASGAPPTFGVGGQNTIDGFTKGDLLIVNGVDTAANHVTYDPTSHVLTADFSGEVTATFYLAGTYQNSDFALITSSPSLPIGSFAIEDTVACFRTGTLIATPSGERAVETLRAGDLVLTASGQARPVRWIGHRHVVCARHPRPASVWPVRIRAHAFGPSRPRRDLWLSPEHAVLTGGVLIPVRCLVNGETVAQQPADAVTYVHVELDRHDAVLAEGLPCESFLDTGNRAAFANGGTVVQAHPEFARAVWDADACAPLVLAGPALDAARARLHEAARSSAVADDAGTRARRRPVRRLARSAPSLFRCPGYVNYSNIPSCPSSHPSPRPRVLPPSCAGWSTRW